LQSCLVKLVLVVVQSTMCLKKFTPVSCYNLDIHEPILMIFGRQCYWECKQ